MPWFFTICLLLTGLHCNPDAHADDIVALRAQAEQGDAEAQVSLGFMYGNGQGVVPDDKQADKWYNLAAANSKGETYEQAARPSSIVEKKMTPPQVAEAQRLVGEWQVVSRRPEESGNG